MTDKLYLIEFKYHGIENCYVVAANPSSAYKKARKGIDDMGLGCSPDREMKTITLLAEEADYPDCEARLFK